MDNFEFLKKIVNLLTSRDQGTLCHSSNLMESFGKDFRQERICHQPDVSTMIGSKVIAQYVITMFVVTLTLFRF